MSVDVDTKIPMELQQETDNNKNFEDQPAGDGSSGRGIRKIKSFQQRSQQYFFKATMSDYNNNTPNDNSSIHIGQKPKKVCFTMLDTDPNNNKQQQCDMLKNTKSPEDKVFCDTNTGSYFGYEKYTCLSPVTKTSNVIIYFDLF